MPEKDYETFGEAWPLLLALEPCPACGQPQRARRLTGPTARSPMISLVLQNLAYHLECGKCGHRSQEAHSIRQLFDDWNRDEGEQP